MALRVAVVDDNSEFVERFGKTHPGECDFTVFSDAESFWKTGGARALAGFDALLVDLHLPAVDGISLFRRLRAECADIPISFLLTADRREEVRLLALECGFLDVLRKDSPSRELLLRVRNASARIRPPRQELRLVPELLELRSEWGVAQMTPVEFRLMGVLLRQAPLQKDRLIEMVWRETKVSSQTLNSHVFNLNRKLETVGYQVNVDRCGEVVVARLDR